MTRDEKIIDEFNSDFISARVRDGVIYFIDNSNGNVFAKVQDACIILREEFKSPIPDLRDI